MNGLVLGWVCLQQTEEELKEIKQLLLYTTLPWEIINSFLQNRTAPARNVSSKIAIDC